MNRVFLISFFLLLTGGICAQQATTGTLTLKEAEQRILLSAIRMRITHTRKTERPQMQPSFRGQILTLQSEVRKGDLLL